MNFLLNLTSDKDAASRSQRGLTHYAQLYQKLVGIPLRPSTQELGPITVNLLLPDHEPAPCRVATADRTALLLGRPSSLASEGELASQVPSLVESSANSDALVRKLQGDFVVVWVHDKQQSWEVQGDAVGLARLFMWQANGRFLISSTLYLLAACMPLELDPLGCHTLDLCGYLFGAQTIFKNVAMVEMDKKIRGDKDSCRIDTGFHFAANAPRPCNVDDVAHAYFDAARPRLPPQISIFAGTTGGTDSRLVLALMSHLRLSPTVFCWRWDETDTMFSLRLANELGLDHFTTTARHYLGPGKTQASSVLAEALIHDGCLTGMFQKRNYLHRLTPNDVLTTGHYGESTVKSAWGIGYAGMMAPSPEKIVHRLATKSAIRRDVDSPAFVSSEVEAEVAGSVARIMNDQANQVKGVDSIKLCNYLYLRNRGARWAAQSLSAAAHFARVEFPLSYAAGVGATWRTPSSMYSNLGLVRSLLDRFEPRLSRWPFADGSPSTSSVSLTGKLKFYWTRKVKKGMAFVANRHLKLPMKKSRGNVRPNWMKKNNIPLWEQWPSWCINDSERRTRHIYRSFISSPDTLDRLQRCGHLRCIATLEFASRIYDGAL